MQQFPRDFRSGGFSWFPRRSNCGSTGWCRFRTAFSIPCAVAAGLCLTSGGDRTRLTTWRISRWPRSRRSSCKARRFWPISAIWRTGQGRSNCQTFFGMRKIPGDSQIRAKLDAIEPKMFLPMFADLVAELDQCGGLDAMRCLDGHVLIALDGTEFHCSDKVQQF